jgi:hypothetical protein
VTFLLIVFAVAIAGATYCAGLRRGRAQGRRSGYIQGHEHALASASRIIEDGVFRLAERVVEDCGGRYSPTLSRFLSAFSDGGHLR